MRNSQTVAAALVLAALSTMSTSFSPALASDLSLSQMSNQEAVATLTPGNDGAAQAALISPLPDPAPSHHDTTELQGNVQDQQAKTDVNSNGTSANGDKLAVGTHFAVSVQSTHTSKTAQVGDPVEARLKDDLIVGSRVVATKGSLVVGHVCSVDKARSVLKSEFNRHRWMKSAGSMGIQFDEIVTDHQDHLPLVATPARQARFVNDMNEGRVLGINTQGEIVSPLSSQLKSQGLHWGIRAAAIAGGPFGAGAVPAAFACLGAINPSFAFMHPVGKNVKHRRLKGFGMGLISGLPGGNFIADGIIHGPEAIVKPGDEFQAEFKKEFTGEISTVATAPSLPNAWGAVHAEILPEKKQ